MPHVLRKAFDNIPISFLFLELYAEFIQANPETDAGEAVRVSYAEAYHKDLSEEDLIHIANRLSSHAEEMAQEVEKGEAPNPAPTSAKARQHGDFFREMLNNLDPAERLLWVSGYDVAKAKKLYEVEDYEVVNCLINLKKVEAMEAARLTYEGALFGFGGKYGTAHKSSRDEGDVTVTDLRQRTAAEVQALIASRSQRS